MAAAWAVVGAGGGAMGAPAGSGGAPASGVARRRGAAFGTGGAFQHFDLEHGMNLPRGRAPGMMVIVLAHGGDARADIRAAVMIIVPQEITGEANLARRIAGRDRLAIGRTHEAGQFLETDAGAVKLILQSAG